MGLEESTEDRKWIFNYLGASGDEIEMGLYETDHAARVAMIQMKSFGAICLEPTAVPPGYHPLKDPYHGQ